MKLFIRSCAHRPGLSANAPWIVTDALVKKFSLPSKFADIFMSPLKVKCQCHIRIDLTFKTYNICTFNHLSRI